MANPGSLTNRTPKKKARPGKWQATFLSVLRDTANVRASCDAAGVTRVSAYEYRQAHPEFDKAWKDALDDACDVLERVARERAQETSDTLLIFLLKSHRPDVYREPPQRIQHSGPDGGPITVVYVNDWRGNYTDPAAVSPLSTSGPADSTASGETP